MRIANVLIRLLRLLGIAVFVLFNFKLNGPQKLRSFLERAGGAFIKLGQILALRQDFLPLSYANELLRLLNKVPSLSFEKIQAVLAEEISGPMTKYFSEFNTEPIASGSISQVYSAYLREGTKVAVKIQRPAIREKFERDFILIYFLANILDIFRLFSSARATEVVSEFISWTRNHLDFRYEAKNATILCEHSRKHPQTIIPRQYPDLTTSRILVQEFIEDSISLEEILLKKIKKEELLKKNIDPDKLTIYLVKDQMRQYFIDGFFHADPHPTNLFFLPFNKLAYLDFGIVSEARENRKLFLRFFHALSQKDTDSLSENILEFGQKTFNEEAEIFLQINLSKRKKTEEIFKKLRELVLIDLKKEIAEISFSEKNISPVFLKIAKIAEKYGVLFPREITLFLRSLSILDMAALQISSSFNIIKALNDFFRDFPLETAERLIVEGIHKKEVGEKIISLTDLDWEFFREISFLEREKRAVIKEKMIERLFHYAEKYEEIKKML